MLNKIFSIEYICSSDIEDADIALLMNGDSFTKSFIVYQYRLVGDTRNENEIIDYCKQSENWYDENMLDEEKYNILYKTLVNAYYNIWRYSIQKCRSMAEMWMLNFAFIKIP